MGSPLSGGLKVDPHMLDMLSQVSSPKLTGGNVNYYLVNVTHPQREDQAAYQAECDDIADALELNPDEKDIFKEIWRSANARKHNGKPGHTAIYGAEKIVHRAARILRRLKLKEAEDATQPANGTD